MERTKRLRQLTVFVLIITSASTIFALFWSNEWPRPPGVPSDINARFTPLEGTTWNWCQDEQSGSLRWRATQDRGLSVTIYSGTPCRNKRMEEQMVVTSDEAGRLVFPLPPTYGATQVGGPCPFTISSAQRSALLRVADEAVNTAPDSLQKRVLREVVRSLISLDGVDLIATAGGWACTERPKWSRGPDT
jgi:hypothetical protein